MADDLSDCRIYLQLPATASPQAEANLAYALENADIACVLLAADTDQPGQELDLDWARRVLALCQRKDAALLLQDAAAASAVGADGIHIGADIGLYQQARELLGQSAVIGVYCAKSRHDAMVLAELGADYVAFPARMQSMTQTDEFFGDPIRWWSDIFEIPSVAWDIASAEEAAAAAGSGADFVALTKNCVEAESFPQRLAEIVAALRSTP